MQIANIASTYGRIKVMAIIGVYVNNESLPVFQFSNYKQSVTLLLNKYNRQFTPLLSSVFTIKFMSIWVVLMV